MDVLKLTTSTESLRYPSDFGDFMEQLKRLSSSVRYGLPGPPLRGPDLVPPRATSGPGLEGDPQDALSDPSRRTRRRLPDPTQEGRATPTGTPFRGPGPATSRPRSPPSPPTRIDPIGAHARRRRRASVEGQGAVPGVDAGKRAALVLRPRRRLAPLRVPPVLFLLHRGGGARDETMCLFVKRS